MADAQEVCRSYRNTQNCRYGTECRFEHSNGEPIAQPPRKLGECHSFRDSGECQFGEKCRFLHGAEDPRVDESGSLKRNLGDEVCRNYQHNVCRFGDKCRRKHEGPVDAVAPGADGSAPARAPRRRQPRAAGTQSQGAPASAPANSASPAGANGTAAPKRRRVRRRGPRPDGAAGDASQQQPQQQRSPAAGGAAGNGPRRNAPRGPRIPSDQIVDEEGREVCRTYYHLHRCRFAEKCRFVHVAGPNPIKSEEQQQRPAAARAPREPRPPQVCRNFAETATCTFGDLCRFQHGESDPRDMADVQAKHRARRAQLREAPAATAGSQQ